MGTGHNGAPDTYKGEMQMKIDSSCTTSIQARKVGIILLSVKPYSSSGPVLWDQGDFKMQKSRQSTERNSGDSSVIEV